VLAALAQRHVHVRGLVWRPHPHQDHFSEQENLHLVETINDAGGEVLLDERVRRDGSHHQKLFVVRHPDRPRRDVAFVGGIDLCHGRGDAWRNGGRTGPRPPGRLRHHRTDPVKQLAQLWSQPLHSILVDPDGRPRSLRHSGSF
jgi:hypothetical protein